MQRVFGISLHLQRASLPTCPPRPFCKLLGIHAAFRLTDPLSLTLEQRGRERERAAGSSALPGALRAAMAMECLGGSWFPWRGRTALSWGSGPLPGASLASFVCCQLPSALLSSPSHQLLFSMGTSGSPGHEEMQILSSDELAAGMVWSRCHCHLSHHGSLAPVSVSFYPSKSSHVLVALSPTEVSTQELQQYPACGGCSGNLCEMRESGSGDVGVPSPLLPSQ